MLIRIYLKSGNVLPDFPCDEFTINYSPLTNGLAGYKYKGGKNPRPFCCDPDQIEAICRVDTAPVPDSKRVAELEAELARAMFYITAQKSCTTCRHGRTDMQFCAADCGECSVSESCVCAECFNGSRWEWIGADGNERAAAAEPGR